jgi:SAM-dependent methyltransferase
MQTNVQNYQYVARVYRLFFPDFEASMREEGRWLEDVLRPRDVRSVLDACCGTGRQAIPLAEAGFSVVGADPCTAMLDEARALAERRGVQVKWLESDFEALPASMAGSVDAVIALGNGLCHCSTRESLVSALTALRRCCRRDGVCLIGIKDFDLVRAERVRDHPCGCHDDGTIRSDLTQTWEFEDPVLVCNTTLWRREAVSGRVRTVLRGQTREYMLGREEMRYVSREAGFSDVEILDHPGEAVYLLSA